MSCFRPMNKVLRWLTQPIRDGVRKKWMAGRIQKSVPLQPEDRTEKRRRMHVLVDLIQLECPETDVTVAEIGVRGGRSGAHMLKYCSKIKTLYGVDLRKPDAERSPIWKHDRVRFIQGWSHEVAEQFEDRSLDLCFIDADHSESSVRADLAAWAPKVKPGGILAGHDYGSKNHVGVKIAVDDFFKTHPHPVHLDADKVWWTRTVSLEAFRGESASEGSRAAPAAQAPATPPATADPATDDGAEARSADESTRGSAQPL